MKFIPSQRTHAQTRSLRLQIGFTLVELLTVIAIIGILAAIVLAVVGKARQLAMKAQTISNLRQVHTGFILYSTDHGGRLPINYEAYNADEGIAGDNWRISLANGGYLGSPDHHNDALTKWAIGDNFSVLGSPLQRQQHPLQGRFATFGANSQTIGGERVQLARFENPSKTLLLGEGWLSDTKTEFRLEIWASATMRPEQFPYGEKTRMIFVDGHVEMRGFTDIPHTITPTGSPGWWFWVGRQ